MHGETIKLPFCLFKNSLLHLLLSGQPNILRLRVPFPIARTRLTTTVRRFSYESSRLHAPTNNRPIPLLPYTTFYTRLFTPIKIRLSAQCQRTIFPNFCHQVLLSVSLQFYFSSLIAPFNLTFCSSNSTEFHPVLPITFFRKFSSNFHNIIARSKSAGGPQNFVHKTLTDRLFIY